MPGLANHPKSVLFCWAVALLAAFVTLSCSHEQAKQTESTPKKGSDPAIAVLDQAIRAHGISAGLDAVKAGRLKLFTLGIAGHEWEDRITEEVTFQIPDKLKRVTIGITKTSDGHERRFRSSRVRNGSKAWAKADDGRVVRDSNLDLPTKVFPLSVLYNIGDLRDRRFDLSVIAPRNDRAAVTPAIHVETREGQNCDLMFDGATMLLARIVTPGYDPRTGKAALQETRFSDYRTVQGITFPMSRSTTLDGRLFSEVKVLEFELLEDVPEGEFSEPKSGW
jgi:hypothetical protein